MGNSQIRGLGELLRLPPGLLLLSYMTLLILVQVTTEDLMPSSEFETAFVTSSGTPLSSKSAVYLRTIPSTRFPLTTGLHLVRRGLRSNFPLEVASPPNMVSATPFLSSLTTTGEPSSSSLHLYKRIMQQSQLLSPASMSVPSPVGQNSSIDSNVSSVPPSLAEPPISHHSGCCGPNTVQRRGTRDCHCVYPVKVELFLWNVSQRSNWSNEFLEKLASQLNLQVTQFEIDNFYVVGLSGLNITMDIAPHTGISFSAAQVHAMNNSLTLHKVFIDPNVIGGYKVLNFTWFESPTPSPAPALVILPKSPPPSMSYFHKPNDEANSENHRNLTIIVGICAALLVVVVITVLVICSCRSVKGNKSTTTEIAKLKSSLEAPTGESSLPHPTSMRFLAYEELKEATNNFETSSVLGEGGFGRVFKGVLSDGTAVAIKKLNNGGHQGDKEFLVEVEMLSRLHHRNLVKLVGYFCSRNSSQNLLCYELVSNGSLEAWLHGPLGANCPLDWDTRMKIALDSARGLAYLHEDSQPSVIHRDFKASNILLENNFHAKVSDFGLAKQAPEGRTNYLSTRVMGTFGYVAPEYAMTGHLLVKSDVYSYGVVLLELLTGRRPVDMSQPSGQENLVTWARPLLRDKDRLEELADSKLEGKYPLEDFVRVCTIAAACVAPEANQRPTMGEVVQSLKMVQRLAEYQDTMPTPSARPNIRQSSTTYESDGTSSMFSSGPFSGMSVFDNENISRTAVFSEDLHEGR
ncbi:proline-rich receptor-like protein kinase PERK15 isoform X1 [Dendrobium catenatum]|uniref:Receptor-like serine/threonine-protein kinase ALE2 n=1 Tax=Dendrobium catenatum TaxID=906689 RepID=A0A2I0WSF2_9ASPA|nr:proline-rich receptor-like protein kinase PERK15 isoform X1 [Dendrobium catenatum]PKU78567.1 Receptor-like serine/threonine-protein kinase ALE2 [Dendrobium catenatum]